MVILITDTFFLVHLVCMMMFLFRVMKRRNNPTMEEDGELFLWGREKHLIHLIAKLG